MRASNCKHETSNGRCGLKGCYAYRHKCFTEDLCKCHEPMTNADRIRAMSDVELAKELSDYTCPPSMGGDCHETRCQECWLDWLQQPVSGADQPFNEAPSGDVNRGAE